MHIPPAKPKRWWRTRPFLFASVGAHVLFALIAGYVVVSKYSADRKLTFKAGPKSPNPAERALEHRVQVQQKTQSQSAPANVPKRILSAGAAKVQLPPLPAMPQPEQGAPKMSAAGGVTFGAAAGPIGSAGGGGGGPAINFFGIRDASTNVVIVIDVSDSMFGRTGDADYDKRKLVKFGKDQNFQAVRDEAIKLVQSLVPGSQFGIVRFSGGAYLWKPELVPATDENKKAAIEHIQKELDYHKAPKQKDRPGGTRHDYAFEEAFKLKPDGGVMYLLTDGNASGDSVAHPGRKISPEDIFKVIDDGQRTLKKRAKIHAIYYVTGVDKPEERQMLSSLAARNGGQFTRVDARGRKR